jgi:DNA-binding IclR family transcriptional regulator
MRATKSNTTEPLDAQDLQVGKAVAKALGILDCFTEQVPRLALAEICAKVGLAPSTVRRFLATLESLGYVQRDSMGLYQLGAHLLSHAPAALAGYEVRNQALPVLEDLSKATGLNANLAVLHEGRILYLAATSHNVLHRHFGVPGRLGSAHATAMGKLLLAYLPLESAMLAVEQAGGLPARTAKTITTWERLAEELASIRERGYAVDDEEVAEGGLCLAAPVRDRTGQVVAAMSASGMTWEIDRAKIEEVAEAIKRHAGILSYKLGYAFSMHW